MSEQVNVAVIGNCQANPLASMLRSVAPVVRVNRTVIVHLAKDAERDEIYQALAGSDVILAQRVVDNYPCVFVRNAELRAAFGERVVVWPNLYYRGYSPELAYLRDDKPQPLQGPLGDYHLSPIHDAWLQGLSLDEAITRFRDPDYHASRFSDVPEDSLRELEERESECDVRISDYVAEQRWEQRLFFTFNHPAKTALVELARRALEATGLGEQVSAKAMAQLVARPAEPLGRWRVPMNPWIARTFGAGMADIELFQGNEVDLSGGRPIALKPIVHLSLDEVAATYYRVYDLVFGG